MNKFAPQGRSKLVQSSIINPEMSGLRLILVPFGEEGKPNSVLYDVLDKKWMNVKTAAKIWHATRQNFKLGNIETTSVQSDTSIVHFLCYNKEGKLDLTALTSCVKKTVALAKYDKGSIHISTLFTDQVPELSELVKKEMLEQGLNVNFYQEPAAQ